MRTFGKVLAFKGNYMTENQKHEYISALRVSGI
jgi:hypothetical protein